MNRKEAEDYIYSSYMKALPYLSYDLPDSGKRHPEYTEAIIKKLYAGTPSIAVTGSKGKGSAAYILAAILGTYGRTGLMTGPHISSFNERFRIGEEFITDEELTDIVSGIKPLFDDIKPDPAKGEFVSPIGIETAIAESYFSGHETEFDIYEHGKGVRYDDVKNIPASYGIINSVFLEHTRELGGTIEAIAGDKSHIIRAGMKGIFAGWQLDSASSVISRRAKECKVPLYLAGRDFDVSNITFMDGGMSCTVTTKRRRYEELRISLIGTNQCRNLALAMAAAEDIIGERFCDSDESERRIREALFRLEWFGRLSVIRREPLMLADCCINRASADGAMEAIERLAGSRAVFILAIPDDKDYMGVAEAVSSKGYGIILTKVKNKHYRFDGIQMKELLKAGISCEYKDSLIDAMRAAKDYGYPAAVLGTTAMLPEIREALDKGEMIKV